jgi:LCP family protein required for cell wall assembly
MIEEELRATFARHEPETPAAGPIRDRINLAFVRRKRRRAATRAAGVAVAVLVAAGVTPWALADRHPPVVNATPLMAELPAPAPAGSRDILLLGTDRRLAGDAGRADTVLIVHVSADRRTAYLVSLPRDARVAIPGHGTDRLATTLLYGGPALTRRVVTGLTGVTFDATVTVDTAVLAKLTEAVGGVRVCLDRSFTSTHNGKHYQAGCQQLTGADVVPVLRARRQLANGASDRDRNAQRYLVALADRLASAPGLADPVEVSGLVRELSGRDLTVDGSATDLLRVAETMRSTTVIGISDPTATAEPFPEDGAGLFAAVRDDRLAGWAQSHPSYVLSR